MIARFSNFWGTDISEMYNGSLPKEGVPSQRELHELHTGLNLIYQTESSKINSQFGIFLSLFSAKVSPAGPERRDTQYPL